MRRFDLHKCTAQGAVTQRRRDVPAGAPLASWVGFAAGTAALAGQEEPQAVDVHAIPGGEDNTPLGPPESRKIRHLLRLDELLQQQTFFGLLRANGCRHATVPLNQGSPTPLHYPLTSGDMKEDRVFAG